jgi:hypothetical protein
MDLRSLAHWVPGIHFLNEMKAEGKCILPGHPDSDSSSLLLKQNGERLSVGCYAGLGHTTDAILSAWHLTRDDLIVSRPAPQEPPAFERKRPEEPFSANGSRSNGTGPANGQSRRVLAPIDIWRFRVAKVVEADCEQAHELTYQNTKPEALIDSATDHALDVIRQTGLMPPDKTDLELEVHNIAAGVVQGYLDKYDTALVERQASYVMSFELHGTAIMANEEYLKRDPVIAGLCYASAVSMITGGKHAGKSTLARWMAICVAKKIPFLEREVQQGQVLYLASEDETMAARQELLRLGWGPEDPIKFLSMSTVTIDQVAFLKSLTDYIRDGEVKLIIMDMLFDFARITDEMSYAQTREALGTIQKVASAGNSHIVVVHHAPKHATFSDAAVTALGSQGLAARVSPIILVRRHGPGVHSVVTTSVRDPRGQAIDEKRLTLKEDGSLTLGKAWKDWMQAEVFAPKVFDLFEAEPGQEMTRPDVQEALGISQQLASACLRQLHSEGKIVRSGSGKKGQPYRYCIPLTEISPANEKSAKKNSTRDHDLVPTETNYDRESQGRFGYKESSSSDDLDEYGISKSK